MATAMLASPAAASTAAGSTPLAGEVAPAPSGFRAGLGRAARGQAFGRSGWDATSAGRRVLPVSVARPQRGGGDVVCDDAEHSGLRYAVDELGHVLGRLVRRPPDAGYQQRPVRLR